MDDLDSGELRTAIDRGCGLTPLAGALATHESLLDELARRVEYLLRHRPEKLMYYLYALDVSEDLVAQAFEPEAGDSPARAIAQAILDREATRIRTRKRYEAQSRSGVPPLSPRPESPGLGSGEGPGS